MTMVRPVTVAVDGSATAQAALDWAVDEAVSRGLPLRVEHAWSTPAIVWTPYDIGSGEPFRAAAEQVVADARARVRRAAPDLAVEEELSEGPAVPALLAAAGRSTVVVLGSRGRGGFRGALLGSVSTAVSSQAACPVVVVRPGAAAHAPGDAPGARVVVGIDGTDVSADAASFAAELAVRRGAQLVAVHAWPAPSVYDPGFSLVSDEAVAEKGRLAISETLAGVIGEHPGLDVAEVVAGGHPVDVILAQAQRAALVVVGSHRGGAVSSALLGSVSRGVLHHAEVPVAVVRRARAGW